jgi:hypothetical protein
MAKIIINPKPSFQQRLRRFSVFIDGTKAGEVLKGNPEEFVVAAGVHTVQCKMNWYSSNTYEISVNESDVKFLQVQSNMPYFWFVYVIFIGSLVSTMFMRWADIEKPANFDLIRAIILVIVALYFLFFSLVKRKTYLKISEDTRNIFNT